MTKVRKLKLSLTSWEMAAIEMLLEGSVKIDSLEPVSLKALLRKVDNAWSATPPEPETRMTPRALE